MLIEKIKLKAKKVLTEERDFLQKDGVSKVHRKIVKISCLDSSGDFVKITSFDPAWKIPAEGEEFLLPPVRRLECMDGIVQEVTC